MNKVAEHATAAMDRFDRPHSGLRGLRRREGPMIAVLSIVSLCAGCGLSYASTRSSRRMEFYELWGGRLILVGLVLIGANLPILR